MVIIMKKYLIAIDAGGTFMKSAIVSNDAEIVDGSIYSTEANSNLDADAVHQGYIRTLETQLANAARQNIELSAVAIDTPGPFDYENGYSLMQHKYKAIYKLPLRPWIQEIADLPVTFIHDSAAYLTGELWHSPYGDYRNAAGVMIGTGLGFATMKDGVVLRKPDGSPLYSIWQLPYRGRIAEDFISGRGISERYSKADVSAKEIERRAYAGDSKARRVYETTGDMLGEIIAPYLKLVEAKILILGGQISRALPLFKQPLEARLKEIRSLEQITGSQRLESAHMLGAACDCFSRLGLL